MINFRKPSSDGDRENVVDRLSSLPDDILIHILSFLPIKIYVKTSILGRRWRFLWARVPNLDFGDVCIHDDDDDARFSSIINRVMFLHKRLNISSFRLCLDQELVFIGRNDFKKWISTAIDCNVQELDLHLAWEVKLPKCIFTCKTLVHLRLSFLDMPTIGNTVNLPSLKTLLLHQVYFLSVECFHHLLSGCPVLNELFMTTDPDPFIQTDLEDCFFPKDSDFSCCISSPTIHRLELDNINWNEGVFRVKLDTPTLEYLKLENYEPYFSHEDLPEVFTVPHSAFFASTKTFHNITDLELVADWCFIPSFLEKANNLQVLTIHSSYGKDYPTYWTNPNQVPACLVSHLGTVRIRDFCYVDQEINAVRYILMNAKVLKRMEIYAVGNSRMDSYKQYVALEIISLFERGSDACQLAFH